MITLNPIGHVTSSLVDRDHAPKQGDEGAPNAWLVFKPEFQDGLSDLATGDEILVLTWLHRSQRATLRVHPRDDPNAPLRGVFSTRSQDRPNPVGSDRVGILEVASPTRSRFPVSRPLMARPSSTSSRTRSASASVRRRNGGAAVQNSRHTIVARAGHEIHLFGPPAVNEAIADSGEVSPRTPLQPRS